MWLHLQQKILQEKKKRRLLLMGSDIFDPEADLTNWENHVLQTVSIADSEYMWYNSSIEHDTNI